MLVGSDWSVGLLVGSDWSVGLLVVSLVNLLANIVEQTSSTLFC